MTASLRQSEPTTKTMQIGELARASGTSTKTIRFYEEAGVLPPAQRAKTAIGSMGLTTSGAYASFAMPAAWVFPWKT